MIIDLYFARNETAVSETAKKYGERCTSLARAILRSQEDAEECLSDVWMKVWNAIPPKQPDPLSGFVYQTGRYIALDKLRYITADKRDGRYDASIDELAECIPSKVLEETVEARELGRAINAFLAGQRADNRAIFLCGTGTVTASGRLQRIWNCCPTR